LYAKINGELENLDELPTCRIGNQNLTVKQLNKGIYYVEVYADSDVFTDNTEYFDIWGNIKFNGVTRPDIRLRFVPKPDSQYYEISDNLYEPKRYGVSISGIKYQERLSSGEKRKLNVLLRKPYTVAENDVTDNIFFKLFVKQGPNHINVIDWSPVGRAFNSNHFYIDTTWLVPNVYFIDIKIITNGEVNLYNEILKFNVVSRQNF
jgi:hypothetical protein